MAKDVQTKCMWLNMLEQVTEKLNRGIFTPFSSPIYLTLSHSLFYFRFLHISFLFLLQNLYYLAMLVFN